MNVLVLGKGGREHALINLLKHSTKITQLYALNGNPGMRESATILVGEETNKAILSLCKEYKIDWVIPGGESYLSQGITDYLTPLGFHVFGPTKKAAQIESSKAYAKMIMQKHHIPTADFKVFSTYKAALSYVTKNKPPYVIKYDGLALGKGVTIAKTLEEAQSVLHDILEKRQYGMGDVLIEDFLEGEEYSMICMVYNNLVVPLPLAKDYKARYENHQGPNTGGMGAYSPVAFVDEAAYNASLTIMQKAASGMIQENTPFVGFLYGGFILTEDGPKIIEFNCRLGDPEAEVILPRIKSDFMAAIEAVCNNQTPSLDIDPSVHLGVVMVSDGYPEAYAKGFPLTLPSEPYITHMGTIIEKGVICANGGRVLLVKGEGDSLSEAKRNAYQRLPKEKNPTLKFRSDIGVR